MPRPASDQSLSPDEVEELEHGIDAVFENSRLPTDNRYTSRRAVLTTCEDQLRFSLMQTADAAGDPQQYRTIAASFVHQIDQYKYALKAALALIDARLPDLRPAQHPVDEASVYTQAAEFALKNANGFAVATRVFSAVRAGWRVLYREADGVLRVSESEEDRSYPALEGLLGTDDGEFSPIMLLVQLFRGRRFFDAQTESMVSWSPEIERLVEKTDVLRGRVKYQFILNVAKDLFEIFDREPDELPADWRFPWGSVADARAVFGALQTRCFYHLLAVHFGANRRKLRGGSFAQICLEVTPELLAKDISRITDLALPSVYPVLDALTYGRETKNPDPALQPIVPSGRGQVLLPPFLILSSAWARNMLSLHARVVPKSFDRQSHIFEREMVKQLAAKIPERILFRENFELATQPATEEVDLVLADLTCRTILLCELRWMIQPGDIREVLQRQQTCREKVTQALRKRDAARRSLSAVLRQLTIDPAERWQVHALVVIDNFGGTVSPEPKQVPVVPRKAFERALSLTPDLLYLHAAFTSPDWLPRDGSDYHRFYSDFDLGNVVFKLPQMQVGREAYMRTNLTRYLTAAYSRSVEDLRAQPW